MTQNELDGILDDHEKWLNDGGGKRADLRDADLSGADLSGADLRDADLSGAVLRRADLRDADLRRTDLRRTDLRRAVLRRAVLRRTDLRDADLSGAVLRRADLRDADLRRAVLRRADLSGADLSGADLRRTDLSGAEGITSASDYLEENFDFASDGLICYKTFGQHYDPPEYWTIEEGAVLEQVVNPCRTIDCACGVNVATREWVGDADGVWKCLIRWEDMADVVVPYHTDGKIRAGRVELLEQV